MKYKNSLQKGSVRYIVFKEAGTWYGVGLEFNIVVEADTQELALYRLFEAIKGYVISARKVKARSTILNQRPETEYESLWRKLVTARAVPSPYQVAVYGQKLLANA